MTDDQAAVGATSLVSTQHSRPSSRARSVRAPWLVLTQQYSGCSSYFYLDTEETRAVQKLLGAASILHNQL